MQRNIAAFGGDPDRVAEASRRDPGAFRLSFLLERAGVNGAFVARADTSGGTVYRGLDIRV